MKSLPFKMPQVDKVLRHPRVVALEGKVRRQFLAELTRREMAAMRKSGSEGDLSAEALLDDIAVRIERKVDDILSGNLQRVLNGTGVILNTNLGRAPLPESTAAMLADLAQGYCNLEVELESGKRGERTAYLDELLGILTGCDKAIVVNNNASSVMLAVSALAQGKEVIVSRGELIEIGGSFRLPDVITIAGGILKEVGTTNRTRIDDYRKALSNNTALILKCHRSNFEMSGFTEETSLEDLVGLGAARGLPVLQDLGSGAFVDIACFGLKHEPTVSESIKCGVDAVMFSGDKLTGGLQAGIIAGKKDTVEKMRRNPMYRAVRGDKLFIGLLESVFVKYLAPEPEKSVPVISMASCDVEKLKERASTFCQNAAGKLPFLRLEVVATESAFGGGTVPSQTIPSYGVHIFPDERGPGMNAASLAHLLRTSSPPVIPFVRAEQVIVDFRTISVAEEDALASSLALVSRRMAAR